MNDQNTKRNITIQELKDRLTESEAKVASLRQQIISIEMSRSWRLVQLLRQNRQKVVPPGTLREKFLVLSVRCIEVLLTGGIWTLLRKIAKRLTGPITSEMGPGIQVYKYQQWLDDNAITDRVRGLMGADLEYMSDKPPISFVMPVYNPPLQFLRDAIKSVQSQLYKNWELCIADDGSTHEVAQILDVFAAEDKRIRVFHSPINEGISAATNHAFELVSGEWIAMLDHDDLIAETALYYIVKELNRRPEVDIIYTDKDHVMEDGSKIDPYFKPDWSPHTILSHNYVIHLLVFRTSLIDRIPFMDSQMDGSQDYDLILRLTERAGAIGHIPKVLYSWRRHGGSNSISPQKKAFLAGQEAIKHALMRRGIEGEVKMVGDYGPYKVEYAVKTTPLVSIIISSCRVDLLSNCVQSIHDNTRYDRYEIIVTTNLLENADMREYCSANGLRLFEVRDGFFSKMNNYAARHTESEFIVFLNDDTLIITPEWLNELLMLCNLPEVGAVGPKLILRNGGIQFTRMVLGIRRDGLPYFFDPFATYQTQMFHGFSSEVIADVTAVSGACMMMKREVFLNIGGFDEDTFNLSWQDMDLCLRLRKNGFSVLYTPYAVVIHYGTETKKEMNVLLNRDVALANEFFEANKTELWKGDPFFNPNLTDNHGLFESPIYPGLSRINCTDMHYDQSYWYSYGFPIHNKGRILDDREALIDQYMPFASKVIQASKCQRVVDIGCGPGLLLEAFQRLGVECRGIEFSKIACSISPPEINEKIVCLDITSPNVIEDSGLQYPFCVAICIEVLEHIPKELLPIAMAHVKTLSDVVIISTPQPNMWDRDDTTHVSVMNRASWLHIFQMNNFVEDTVLGAKVFGVEYDRNPDTNLFMLRSRKLIEGPR